MKEPFLLHDSLTGKLVPFSPQEPGVVRMYNCGPTVYGSPHIGNWRANVSWDVLRRALELDGYRVVQVMNLTDVGHLTLDDLDAGEDKLEAASRKEGLDAWAIAQKYIDEFHEDVARLNLRRAHHYPRATETIPDMIAMIEELIAKGHAYAVESGNVYYSVESFPEYGKLSKNTLSELVSGARVEVIAEKRHPADFALWKRDEKHQMQWDSPWGRGFPGWHLECSVMARKYLGDTLDIHSGGEDHLFPHHECEIAQSEGATGKPLANLWMHNRFLLVDGAKMAKRAGTQHTVSDVLAHGESARALRYFLLSTRYSEPMNFTWDALRGAERAVERLDAFARSLVPDGDAADSREVAQACAAADHGFLAALKDDLNMSAALAVVHTFRAAIAKAGPLSAADVDRVRATLRRMDSVLGLDLLERAAGSAGDTDADIQRLVDERQAARAARDFARADAIRDELAARGVRLEDTPSGVRWHR